MPNESRLHEVKAGIPVLNHSSENDNLFYYLKLFGKLTCAFYL
jgi:hypothetical protein